MADICISYARPNKERVSRLRTFLLKKYSVWWDGDIHSGNYRVEIEKQFERARCVIAIWCPVSRTDDNVLDEVKIATKHKIPILPVRFEEAEAPLGYGSLHITDLIDWDGNEKDPRLVQLLENIERSIGAGPQRLNRPASFALGRISDLPAPVFFRSVSSHETQLLPAAAVQALKLLQTKAVLVSAYDLYRRKRGDRILENLAEIRAHGGAVLLDSGNYEAFRKKDDKWTIKQLHSVLKTNCFDAAFCFDRFEPTGEPSTIAKSVVSAVKRDSKATASLVLPIVHAPKGLTGPKKIRAISEIVFRVAREIHPMMIAVPERELGSGIVARMAAVNSIRIKLDELGFYQPLHLLGTGNPVSIALLALAGADSFDGLEWCRTAANRETGHLFHFHQYEFFAYQTKLATSPLVRASADDGKLEFNARVAFHNLDFFEEWMAGVKEMIDTGKIDRFLVDKLPGGSAMLRDFEQRFPRIFQ